MKCLSLSIELLADLHIGTGTGWGDIDAKLVRDRRGWPVLPASHIKGLLREAANEWRRLDPSALSQEDVEYMFGCPGKVRGQLQLTSAYLCANTPSSSLIWGSTQIDDNGKAADHTLRYIEYIPAGSRFSMQIALPQDEKYEELLKALITRCPRLGGGRNRGYGLVRWHLDLEKTTDSKPLLPQSAPNKPSRLRLLLTNLEPICLARTGHPGNLIGSESFIRGRSLRGAFVAACLSLGQAEFAQRLLDETLSWGDALPLPDPDLANAQLAEIDVLPIPLSIGTPKAVAPSASIPGWVYWHEGDVLGSRREIDQITLKEGARAPEKLKRPADGEFLFRPEPKAPWRRYRPQILERLHTQVPSEENNNEQALFSTEEIAERTLFLSDLIVSTPAQASTLIQVLNALQQQWLRIGRAGRPLVIKAAAWLPIAEHGSASGADFSLLLESDLIVCDAIGNFQDRLDADTLVKLAGLPAGSLAVRTDAAFSEGRDLFGFNASTGLPRLAQRAIKAGSVIHVSGPGAADLRKALAQRFTLGECPEEGFGRFRLDRLPVPLPAQAQQIISATTAPAPPAEILCRKAREWVQRFGQTILASNPKKVPSKSQWGDFRGRIQAARSRQELDDAFRLIEAAKDKHGGAAWKGFVESVHYAQFRNELAELPLADAQALLEYFLRWQRALSTYEAYQ